ncbi:MAG: glycosyl transferase [Planctomycetes bacterium DG_23]|nr:MAG: glycosyl transferase [Planctomycetes bacterium DG_23]
MSGEEKELSIVIPVFNERESLEELFQELKGVLNALGRSYEIIFVDDGSTDGSTEMLKGLAQEDRHTRAVLLRRNFGQSAAMSAGFDLAQGRIFITLDADLQNDPGDIPKLLAKMDEGYDVASGWRKQRRDPLFTRRIPSFFANMLISKITSVHLHDYGCTLKAYRREVLKDVRLYGEMHRFLPALASWLGVKVTEVEVNHRPRRFGESKYGLGRTHRVILDLINLKFLLSYSTRPIRIFGGIGMVSLLGGIVSGASVVWMKLSGGKDMTGNPLLLLTVLFILIGIQFITMGLLGEILIRTYHESQGKPIYVVKELVEQKPPGVS